MPKSSKMELNIEPQIRGGSREQQQLSIKEFKMSIKYLKIVLMTYYLTYVVSVGAFGSSD